MHHKGQRRCKGHHLLSHHMLLCTEQRSTVVVPGPTLGAFLPPYCARVARKEKYQRIKSELADYFLTLLPTPRVHILEMHSISSVHSPSQALPTMVFVTLLQSKTFKCYSSTDREMLKSHLSLITAPWIWSNIISMRSAVLEVGSPPESEIWSCVPTKKSKKSYTFCPCQQG